MISISEENILLFTASVFVSVAISVIGNLWVGAFFKIHENERNEWFKRLHNIMFILFALFIIFLVVCIVYIIQGTCIQNETSTDHNQNDTYIVTNSKMPSYHTFEIAFSPFSTQIPLISHPANSSYPYFSDR